MSSQKMEREGKVWGKAVGKREKLDTMLTENYSDTPLFNSVHIPLVSTSHMVPHHCERCWEIQSLAEQLLAPNKSTLWKGKIKFFTGRTAISVTIL